MLVSTCFYTIKIHEEIAKRAFQDQAMPWGIGALTHVSCQRLHSDLTQQQGLRSHLLPWYSPLSGENQTSKFTVSAVVSGVFHASIESWNNNNSPTKIKIL
jgi:hypothetical protein